MTCPVSVSLSQYVCTSRNRAPSYLQQSLGNLMTILNLMTFKMLEE